MEGYICYVAGAGDFTGRGLKPGRGDMLIAADGGFDSLVAFGLKPELLLGDLDSVKGDTTGIETLPFPAEKDDTDMMLALRLGFESRYRRFRLYGASGGRQDHFIANLAAMCWLSKRGAEAMLIAPEFTVAAISGGSLLFEGTQKGARFSVFCQSERSKLVSIKGAKYVLREAQLDSERPLGVSNEFSGGRAEVSVGKGTLLVFCYDSGCTITSKINP